ncbi:hypothetical protein K438DRAFT_1764952 [Mycena galopus ATCC 62051]|nr:hypothetical protein K438DRAFT_1764952 [Mycena galopus ATCC 62051]
MFNKALFAIFAMVESSASLRPAFPLPLLNEPWNPGTGAGDPTFSWSVETLTNDLLSSTRVLKGDIMTFVKLQPLQFPGSGMSIPIFIGGFQGVSPHFLLEIHCGKSPHLRGNAASMARQCTTQFSSAWNSRISGCAFAAGKGRSAALPLFLSTLIPGVKLERFGVISM